MVRAAVDVPLSDPSSVHPLSDPSPTSPPAVPYWLGMTSYSSLTDSMSLKPHSFAAPEVLSGQDFTSQSDVFGFGFLLWELLTRGHPYSEFPDLAPYPDELLFAIQEVHPRPPMSFTVGRAVLRIAGAAPHAARERATGLRAADGELLAQGPRPPPHLPRRPPPSAGSRARNQSYHKIHLDATAC
jgi:serine/threonine protein kinase